ncbi:MAG TPA: hypothetical protein VFH44_04120 [Solirubrobacterales bacterium]|nr:hypothetical protein [Solirubrobacterales bacterium]
MAAEGRTLNPIRAIEGFVFAAEDARRLAALRIGLFGLLAVRLATSGDYAAVAGQPAELFDPVSLFHLLPGMPAAGLTTIVQIAAVVAAVLAAAGIAPRASFPAAFVLSVFLNLMLNSTGKIVHNDLVATLCLIPLLATPTAASRAWAVSVKPLRRRPKPPPGPPSAAYGWPVRLAMIVIGLAYLFVGLQKLRYSGLDWATTDNLRYVLWASSDAQASPNSLALLVADHDWMAHLLAASTLVVEVGFILCLPFRRLRWILVPAVVGLHVGIWLAMGLDYLPQAAAVIIVFVNWPTVIAFIAERAARKPPASEVATS